MLVGKLAAPDGRARAGVVVEDRVALLPLDDVLSDLLFAEDPKREFGRRASASRESISLIEARWLAPIDAQEVWAAGVTYKRSQQARMDESQQAASFYDMVYSAERPELF